jgi:hypothetical protein
MYLLKDGVGRVMGQRHTGLLERDESLANGGEAAHDGDANTRGIEDRVLGVDLAEAFPLPSI